MKNKKVAISSINFYKVIDTKGKMVNYDRWNGVLLFWGLVACKRRTGGDNQPFEWCPPRFILCRGDIDHKRGSFELKVIIAVVLRSSTNSLTLNEGVHLDKINLFGQLLPSSQKHLVWVVVIYSPHLFYQLQSKE